MRLVNCSHRATNTHLDGAVCREKTLQRQRDKVTDMLPLGVFSHSGSKLLTVSPVAFWVTELTWRGRMTLSNSYAHNLKVALSSILFVHIMKLKSLNIEYFVHIINNKTMRNINVVFLKILIMSKFEFTCNFSVESCWTSGKLAAALYCVLSHHLGERSQ